MTLIQVTLITGFVTVIIAQLVIGKVICAQIDRTNSLLTELYHFEAAKRMSR